MLFNRLFSYKFFYYLVGQIWAIPIVIIIRLIRPFIVVRMGCLEAKFVGHYSANVEIYLCERDAGIHQLSKPSIEFWFNYNESVSNNELGRIWKRHLRILPRILLAPVYRLNQAIPFGQIHCVASTYHDRDVHNLLDEQPPHVVFTDNEEAKGCRLLLEMGIPENTPFVCLHVRDGAYHAKMQFTNYRNADVKRHLLAVEELTKQGYYVIRMGKKVKNSLDTSNSKIIDYASSIHRNDFMDIYLGAKCSFVISTSSGWDNIPHTMFRKPILYTNFVPISQMVTWNRNAIAIPKRYWLKREDRFLTLSEIIEIDERYSSIKTKFSELGIDLIENTEEEILDATIEFLDCLSSNYKCTSKNDNRRQREFWEIYERNLKKFALRHMHGELRSRIGSKFLDKATEFTK